MGKQVKPSPPTPSPTVGEGTKGSGRILFIDHADFLGGAERSGLELLKAIDRARFSPTLACPPGALLEAAQAEAIEVIPLTLTQVRGVRNLWSAPFKLATGVRALVRLVRAGRFAIVHSNTMRATVYAAPAAKLSGAKFVWHVRDLHRERAYVWLMSRLADAIIANSRAVANTIPAFVRHKTTVVYNGVDVRDFDPAFWEGAAMRAELGLRCEHWLIGNIGWLAPWKGQRAFIQAASRIAAQCPQARFVIAGDVSDERYCAYAQELKALGDQSLGGKVFWVGARQPIQPVLAALDLLLHCAEREPFGRVLVEAMAMHVPVIAFAGGGPDEIIAHGETGLLIAPHDVGAIAQAALSLLNDPARRQRMGQAARARVQALFDAETTARQVERIYAQINTRRSNAADSNHAR